MLIPTFWAARAFPNLAPYLGQAASLHISFWIWLSSSETVTYAPPVEADLERKRPRSTPSPRRASFQRSSAQHRRRLQLPVSVRPRPWRTDPQENRKSGSAELLKDPYPIPNDSPLTCVAAFYAIAHSTGE